MSWQDCDGPECDDGQGPIARTIRPHRKDLGGFSVAPNRVRQPELTDEQVSTN